MGAKPSPPQTNSVTCRLQNFQTRLLHATHTPGLKPSLSRLSPSSSAREQSAEQAGKALCPYSSPVPEGQRSAGHPTRTRGAAATAEHRDCCERGSPCAGAERAAGPRRARAARQPRGAPGSRAPGAGAPRVPGAGGGAAAGCAAAGLASELSRALPCRAELSRAGPCHRLGQCAIAWPACYSLARVP